jgi:hypothetical protein
VVLGDNPADDCEARDRSRVYASKNSGSKIPFTVLDRVPGPGIGDGKLNRSPLLNLARRYTELPLPGGEWQEFQRVIDQIDQYLAHLSRYQSVSGRSGRKPEFERDPGQPFIIQAEGAFRATSLIDAGSSFIFGRRAKVENSSTMRCSVETSVPIIAVHSRTSPTWRSVGSCGPAELPEADCVQSVQRRGGSASVDS